MIHTHTREQFLNLHVGLGLDFVSVCLFRFSIFVYVSLDCSIPLLLECVLLGRGRVLCDLSATYPAEISTILK